MTVLEHLVLVAVAFPAIALAAFAGVRYVLLPLLARFDAFNEFVFLLAIGWCLAIATACHVVGMSFEVGAIVAGVSLANSPIAQYITDTLRPLRDFFLILFFFSIGAAVEPMLLVQVAAPALVLGAALLAVKPVTFRVLLTWQGESRDTAREIGVRLGQASEFSILVTGVAAASALVGVEAAHAILAATVVTLGRIHLPGDLPLPEPHRRVRKLAARLAGFRTWRDSAMADAVLERLRAGAKGGAPGDGFGGASVVSHK